MERLEKTLEEVSIEKSESKENLSYKGLQLIEDKSYSSGTSIKYWM